MNVSHLHTGTALHDCTDSQLFSLISMGDEQAFRQYYDRYAPRLIPFLERLTRNTAIVEELIQETFLSIWMSRDKLATVAHPTTWTFQVASNVSISWLRKHLKVQLAHEELSATDAGQAPAQDESDQLLRVHEIKGIIQKAIDGLSPQRQLIYVLSRDKGFTIPDVAQYLNLSPHTVKNALVKALAEIRTQLKNAGYHLPAFMLYWFLLK